MANIKRPEVLAPVGDFERLIAAVQFGADAVFLAGKEFGMRASQTNFDNEQLEQAVKYAHENNVKVYVTVNTLPRNDEIDVLPTYLEFLQSINVDAVIASDIGVLSLIKKHTPDMEIHISTQAGIVNYQTALSFYEMGAKRVVLARELSMQEIAEIRRHLPDDCDIEVFVHGAMCMSFSGRCLISNYLTNRDANRGECAQPCRWGYYLVEEKRPNEYYPIFEDEKGSHILNAKDLCMIQHIDDLIKAGVTSLKIEGRAKSSYYVSVITNAYKIAVDQYMNDPENFKIQDWLIEEVQKVSHRKYSTGFYYDTPTQYYENGGYTRDYDVIAIVDESKDGYLYCTQKNKFWLNDQTEVLQPGDKPFDFKIEELYDDKGEPMEAACHPLMKVKIKCDQTVKTGSIIRKQKQD
ncbi:U32 family peptidase [Paludicola sp. MB14-C6]|uniref:peptidase U32 family protein n=1 Tax=Paludihabitans sp. MB14-C6 TaxID=3070656 RepID=UPI0027DE7315|nr:U32 family peptidase [Paludicola sp. MB14-C6]WMJ23433.1 U32 family peptidase [Paludicola sp. MB14-C6]